MAESNAPYLLEQFKLKSMSTMKRLKMRGFVYLDKSELRVRGGTAYDWSFVKKAWELLTTCLEVINTYKKDFLKGYNTGKEGKSLIF